MSNEREEFRKLLDLLNKINKRMSMIELATYSTIYLGWCIWLSTLMLLLIFINIFKLPDWVFFLYLVPSFILTLIYSNIKLPRMLRFIQELVSIAGYGERSYVEIEKKIYRIMYTTWIIGFIPMIILGVIYGELGSSSGLLIALGVGNLTTYLILWFYYKILLRGGVALSTSLLLLAGLNTLLSIIRSGYEWIFAITVILLIYLLFSIYLILLAFR